LRVVEKQAKTMDKGKAPVMEHFHTPGSLENILSWGDQPIPEPLDEVVDVESIVYDRKRQSLVRRTQRKRKMTIGDMLC
jgi:hypothetical protein